MRRAITSPQEGCTAIMTDDVTSPEPAGDSPSETTVADQLDAQIAQLKSENAELRKSLLTWRVAAVATWSDVAAEAMKTASEVKELKAALRTSEVDRLELAERHHQLNQIHHQLNERHIALSRRYGKLGRLSALTGSDVARRVNRAVGRG
jgi:cell division protein ZapA (FtsZ GTPase activity inhibitor)